jgi:hypothetical protein
VKFIVIICILISGFAYADNRNELTHEEAVGRDSNLGLKGRVRNPRTDFPGPIDYSEDWNLLKQRYENTAAEIGKKAVALEGADLSMECFSQMVIPPYVYKKDDGQVLLSAEERKVEPPMETEISIPENAKKFPFGGYTHTDPETGALVFDCSFASESDATYCTYEVRFFEVDGEIRSAARRSEETYPRKYQHTDQNGAEVPRYTKEDFCVSK